MKYKIGDKVKVKSLEWYKSMDKDSFGSVGSDDIKFIADMVMYCGKDAIVVGCYANSYELDIDEGDWSWYDWMLEDEPTISEQLKEKRFHAACCAMNGILSTEYSKQIPNDKIIQMSYMLADELLKQGGFTE